MNKATINELADSSVVATINRLLFIELIISLLKRICSFDILMAINCRCLFFVVAENSFGVIQNEITNHIRPCSVAHI